MRNSLAIAVLTFALFVIGAGCVVQSRTNANQSDRDELPTVTICQLLERPEQFHQKVVRVIAIYENAFEASFLNESNCKSEGRSGQREIWMNYDKSFVHSGDSEEAKQNKLISGFGQWSITAVGRFIRAKGPERFGHLGCCKFEFELIRIEKAERLPDKKRVVRPN